MEISWDQFPVVAFIDSNVALECLALDQLPWREVASTGPILVLITPTVMQEVDSKKHHPRLGDHARRFNKALRPLLQGQSTVVVRPSPDPRVEVGLADCPTVNWTQYPELERQEADARVVAQALCTRGPAPQSLVVISHDIRPLQLAKQHGLKIHQIGDGWLRPKEISEADKKASSLQRELDAIKSRQPKLHVSFSVSKQEVIVQRVRDLSSAEREQIQARIVDLQPIPAQKRDYGAFQTLLNDFDHTLSDRYERWATKIVPKYVREYERKLEVNFGQTEILFRVKNVGQVPAESLLIRLTVRGGWLNDRYVVASPVGPGAPKARSSHLLPDFHNRFPRPVVPPGKHEFVVLEEPKRSAEVQIACADFRHGFDFEYRMIGWPEPSAEEFRVDAVVTAANLFGEVTERLVIAKTVQESSVDELIDPETMKFKKSPPVVGLLQQAVRGKDFSDFEFDGSGWDN